MFVCCGFGRVISPQMSTYKKNYEKNMKKKSIVDIIKYELCWIGRAQLTAQQEDEHFICKKNNKSHSDEIAWKSASPSLYYSVVGSFSLVGDEPLFLVNWNELTSV